MTDTTAKRLDITANVLIIIVALIVVGVFIQRYLLSKVSGPGSTGIVIGQTLDIPSTAVSQRTVVLALSTTCKYCSESLPFYKHLAEKVKENGVDVVAVFPQEVVEGKQYLDSAGIDGIRVVQAPLSSLGVTGTPTIVLISESREVVGQWVGKLPPAKEAEVLEEIQSLSLVR